MSAMTSPPRQIKVCCPGCGHLYQDWCRDSINLDLDPGMDDEEYLQECCTATCPLCNHVVDLAELEEEGQ